jgi:hypothetical protein
MYRYEKPIERPRSSKYDSNYWLFHSRKVRRRVAVFSNLEYENILTLEMNPEVEWYCEYPLETTVYVGGKEESILFDVRIQYADGRDAFQGVAYSSAEESHKGIALQAKWCIQNGLEYEYRNEKNIHKGKFLIRNLSVLASRARRFSISSTNGDQMLIGFLSEKKRESILNTYVTNKNIRNGGIDHQMIEKGRENAPVLCSCTLKRIEEIHIIENAGFSVRLIKADRKFVIARQAHFQDCFFRKSVTNRHQILLYRMKALQIRKGGNQRGR